ncbi:hypothetical protein [Thermococcus litoralis]|nr:hypothetical protein [Thermococcus litoralis]
MSEAFSRVSEYVKVESSMAFVSPLKSHCPFEQEMVWVLRDSH